jgi:cellulose synthase/poly-beta-1,6-N-acetylglucosamine synthase-like glycosyltransferase
MGRRYACHEYAAIDEALASPLTPPISILLPAYNEEAGVVESVNALLQLRYPEFEVIVVNDGSKDSTLERLSAERRRRLRPLPACMRGRRRRDH